MLLACGLLFAPLLPLLADGDFTVRWKERRLARGYHIRIETLYGKAMVDLVTRETEMKSTMQPGSYRIRVTVLRVNGLGPNSGWRELTLTAGDQVARIGSRLPDLPLPEPTFVPAENPQAAFNQQTPWNQSYWPQPSVPPPEPPQTEPPIEKVAGEPEPTDDRWRRRFRFCGRVSPVCLSFVLPGAGQIYAGHTTSGILIGLAFLGAAGGGESLYRETVAREEDYRRTTRLTIVLSALRGRVLNDLPFNYYLSETSFSSFEDRAIDLNSVAAGLGAIYGLQLIYSLFLIEPSSAGSMSGVTGPRIFAAVLPPMGRTSGIVQAGIAIRF